MARPERVLALDLSSVCVGYAVFDATKLSAFGRYRQRGKAHGQKLATFTFWLTALLIKYHPDQLLYEAPYAGRRRYAFGVLMMYVGVVLLTYFGWRKAELPEANAVGAAQVKRMVGVAKGRTHEERKRLMVDRINALYKLHLKYKANDRTKKVSEDDTADAIALGHAWLLRQERVA